MPNINAGTLTVVLEGRDVNLTDLITKVENQMQRGAATAKNFDNTIASLTATEKRNESALAAYAQAQARFAEASGNSNLAVQRLVAAMQQLTPNTAAANSVLTQLQGTLNRQAVAAQAAAAAQVKASQAAAAAAAQEAAAYQKSLSGVTNFAAGFQKLIGAYFAVTRAAQAFGATIEAGNQLEKAQATFRGLSGSAEAYEKNLAAARAQQDRFGGSLQDNIEGLSTFANLAKRTGIDINQLANTARALAIVDPAQGFKGASIALKEFFSGDITSLARRFEIPRDRLNELKELAQTDAPAAFQKLQSVLEEFGISQGLLAEQANTTAVAYDKLGGAATDALAAVGQALASGLEPAALRLTELLKQVGAGITSLSTVGQQKLGIEQALLTASSSAEQFNERVQIANGQMESGLNNIGLSLLKINPLFGGLVEGMQNAVTEATHFNEITQAEFDFAKGALEAGTALAEIKTTMGAVHGSLTQLEQGFAIAGESANTSRASLSAFEQAMIQVAQIGPQGAQVANLMAQAVLNNAISTEEATQKLLLYLDGLRQLEASQNTAIDQHDRHAIAVRETSTALGEQAEKTLASAVETDTLKNLQADLARISGAVSAGHISNAQAAAFLASQYNLASGEAERLLILQAKLAGANAAARGFGKGKGVSRGGLAGDLGGAGAQTQKDIDRIKKGQEDLVNAEIALAKAKGNTAQAIDLLRQKQRGLNKDSAEFLRIEAEIIGLEKKDAKKGKGGGGAGAGKAPKLTANEKLHNQLLAAEDKFDAQMEDLEAKHQQKLLDIIAEFAKKQLQVQQENEILKRRSRFDFYSDLNKSQLSPIDRAAFAKAYEDAFLAAQQIAQSGRAKLAQEFLELKKRHIEELKELAEEEAQIRADKDLSKGEKSQRLQELEERRKLLLDAQREEEKQLLEGGDKVHNELNERIADENKAYEDQANKIITAADRAGDAKIRNAERAKIAVDAENKALADQLGIYNQIAQKNGGVLPATAKPTATPAAVIAPTAGTPAPVTAPESIPVTTDKPLPVQPPEGMKISQFDLFLVRDQGVIEAVADQTARLESKLDGLLQQAISSNNNLGGKLDQIKSAISNSKTNGSVRT